MSVKTIKVHHEKESFKEKLSDLFEEVWEKVGQHHQAVSGRSLHDVATDTDLSQANDVLTYELELPGMDSADVEVLAEQGRLVIRGEKADARERTGEHYVFRERRFGSFERSFALPDSAEVDKVDASLSKGVLTVQVPCKQTEHGRTRKIEVKNS